MSEYVNKTDGKFNHGKWIREKSAATNRKPLLNEEYIEGMRDLDDGLKLIGDSWYEWKDGPMTEKSDIKPAQQELMKYILQWMKKTIKQGYGYET